MEESSKRKGNKGNATQWAGIFEKKLAGTNEPKPGKQKIKNRSPIIARANQIKISPPSAKLKLTGEEETQLVINKIEMSGEMLSAEAMEQPRRQP